MSDFTPERREAYIHAMRERRDLVIGLPFADNWETAARLLELDGAGVIDLDSEPGLRAFITARMDLLDVAASAYLDALETAEAQWDDALTADVGPSSPSPSHARRH